MDLSRINIDQLMPRAPQLPEGIDAATMIIARHKPATVSAAIRGTEQQGARIRTAYDNALNSYTAAFGWLYQVQLEERVAGELVDAIAESANIQLPTTGQASHASERLTGPAHEYELIDSAILDASDKLAIAEVELHVQTASSNLATEITERQQFTGRRDRRLVKMAGFMLGASAALGISMASEPKSSIAELATVNATVATGMLGYLSTPNLAIHAQNRQARRHALQKIFEAKQYSSKKA